MRTIIHISDLHFGKTKPSFEKALKEVIEERSPDLIIVSGDITQRATASQFRLAHKFLSSFAAPVFLVPGNHDVPLYSIWRRFYRPYALYRKYISQDLEPQFEDEEMLVVGINTVRITKTIEGRVNKKQIDRVKSILDIKRLPKLKIIVSHHPFNMPVGHLKRPLARARLFWKSHMDSGIDLVLSGHLHNTLARYSDRAYKLSTSGPLFIQAGTALSTRYRWEANSFNVLTLSAEQITIDRYEFEKDKKVFAVKKVEHFIKKDKAWLRD